MRALVLSCIITCLMTAPVAAQPRSEAQESGRASSSGVLSLLPSDSVTEHVIEIGGEKLVYSATVGTLPIFDQDGSRSAAIVYTAYTAKRSEDAARPITFVFNGGPGAASAYLHLGVVGPKVADFGSQRDGATAKLRDNPDSWLSFTDLVMIDPVGTGWSKAAKPDKAGDFWEVESDAQSLAKVITLYLRKHERTASPKYLLGESYGGFRAAKVARALQREQGTIVNGIVMLSPLLDAALQFGANRFALGAALQLPSLAAAELDRRNAFSETALTAAERFAMTDYLTALAGKPPQGEAARGFYARIAEISGLPLDVVTRTRGFIREAYVKNAAINRGEIVSPYDASVAAADPFPESTHDAGADPILDGYLQALSGLFVGYAREQLGFRTDLTYVLLNREVNRRWNWGDRGRSQASIERDMRELLALNPSFRILVAHGRSDLVTPYAVSRYVIDHLPPIGAPDRVALKLYAGGHMFYFAPKERAVFTSDVQTFYRSPEL